MSWEFAATIGSKLLGGIFGRNSAKKQAALQREFAQNRIQWAAADAKKAGLHPLVGATGANAQYIPTNQNPLGDAAADIAQTLGQEAVAKRQAAGNKALNSKQEQLLDAQIAETRSRTLLNQSNAKRTLVGPGSAHDPFAIRKENALIEVQLENGEIVLIPNPDVYETGPSELATGRTLLEGARVVKRTRDPHPPKTQKYKPSPRSGSQIRRRTP